MFDRRVRAKRVDCLSNPSAGFAVAHLHQRYRETARQLGAISWSPLNRDGEPRGVQLHLPDGRLVRIQE
jgi:hypothetical protein